MRLAWNKHRTACVNSECAQGTFVLQDHRIAAKNCLLTTRAAKWATVQVGTGRTVSEVAAELSCDWHTVNDAVTTYGAALLAADRRRLNKTTAIGLDETAFVRRGRYRHTSFVTTVADVENHQIIDIVPSRNYRDVARFIDDQPEELLDDIHRADEAVWAAGRHALEIWHTYWPDDLLVSVCGMGPYTAAATRAWWGDGSQLASAKAAAAFIGLNPSNWESGLRASPSRPITKQGPAELRLAYYQAANVARQHDPELASAYRRLMVERTHNHIKATTAIARKLACRAWAVLQTGKPYVLRDLEGKPVGQEEATAICATLAVPEDVRRRSRARQRGRLSMD
jgi:hypothetical protein